jgi:hypothetical protein
MSTAVPTVGPGTTATANRIAWVDPPGGFLGLSLLNSALRILTLGVYHFWGKTEVRQRIWSAVRIDGEPVEYRGTGGELFRGFIIVFALVLLPLGVITFAAPLIWAPNSAIRGFFEFAAWLLVFTLWGLGIHRARRYRLSRTRWRGIRAGLSGRSGSFAWTYLWTTLLVPLTLGWILPWRAARLQRALFNDTHFGDKAFTFTGRAGPLYARFWLVWLSAVLLFWLRPDRHVDCRRRGGGPGLHRQYDGAQIAQLAGVVLVALLVSHHPRLVQQPHAQHFAARRDTRARASASADVPTHLAGRHQLSHARAVARRAFADRGGAHDALHRRAAVARGQRRPAGHRAEPGRAAHARGRAGGGLQCRCLLTPRTTPPS